MADERNEEQPAEERSAVREFLDAIPSGGIPMQETEDKTAAAPSAEKKDEKDTLPVTEDKKQDEENLPFHKHPRFKRIVEERNQLKAEVEQVNSRLAALEKNALAAQPAQIPQWFVELYGANQDAWTQYQTYTTQEKERIKQEIVQEAQAAKAQEEQSARAMDEWVTGNIQSLKEEGNKFDENKLLKILVDYSPTDKEGNIDFRKGLDILQKLDEAEALRASQKSAAKKEIAATTTSSSAGGGKVKTALKPSQLRKMSWHEAVQ